MVQQPKQKYSKYELSCIYGKYIDQNCFLQQYLTHLAAEYHALQEKFPTFLIDTTARIKSPTSYFEKIDKYDKQGKSRALSDVYANKYILYSANGRSDEATLIEGVYAIRDFLIEFNSQEQDADEIEGTRKDYIANPKPDSGYKSLHLNFQNRTETDLRYETQIKTFRMRQDELTGSSSHHDVYKPLDATTITDQSKIPMYIEPIFLEDGSVELDEKGFPVFRTLSYEESRERFTIKRVYPYSPEQFQTDEDDVSR